MNPVDLIIKKRDGGSLTTDEMNFFVQGAAQDTWPDYQIAAMLMAIITKMAAIIEDKQRTIENNVSN